MLKLAISNPLLLILLLILALVSFSSFSHDQTQTKPNSCGFNAKSRTLAKLIINDPKQNRAKLQCNYLLSKIADEKAKEMASKGRVKHNDSNMRLIRAGYELSKIYPRMFQNNVEALAGGVSKPAQVWQDFKQSNGHRTHLLAEHEFYLLQNEIGVGYFKNIKSPHVDYWVVYVAHKQEEIEYTGEIAKSKE
jgi:uncharacterized protein YkwD